jgi:AcrR family transcriptional regulator
VTDPATSPPGDGAAAVASAPAAPPAGPRRARLDPDARRAQILLCARRLFTAQPYAAVSMEEVARAAQVRRGLVNHYFGSKRALYLAVVKDLLSAFDRAFPTSGTPAARPGQPAAAVVGEHVDRWLAVVEGDADAWFALVGAEGFGRDPDVEALLDRYRDAAVEQVARLLAAVGAVDVAAAGLRTALRSYAGMADVVTREWLVRGSIDRRQAHVLLTSTLLHLVEQVVPALEPPAG